jgi:hypothetical protein
MRAKTKKVFFILGGSAAALVLAAVIFILTFNINSTNPASKLPPGPRG